MKLPKFLSRQARQSFSSEGADDVVRLYFSTKQLGLTHWTDLRSNGKKLVGYGIAQDEAGGLYQYTALRDGPDYKGALPAHDDLKMIYEGRARILVDYLGGLTSDGKKFCATKNLPESVEAICKQLGDRFLDPKMLEAEYSMDPDTMILAQFPAANTLPV